MKKHRFYNGRWGPLYVSGHHLRQRLLDQEIRRFDRSCDLAGPKSRVWDELAKTRPIVGLAIYAVLAALCCGAILFFLFRRVLCGEW